MGVRGLARSLWRRGAVVAALLTVVFAALADLRADEAPVHAATIVVIAAAAAVVRAVLVRHHGLVRFVSGCVVAQPALHLSAVLVPHDAVPHSVGHAFGAVDVLGIAAQVAVALAIVVAVTFTEGLARLVLNVVRVSVVLVSLPAPVDRVGSCLPRVEDGDCRATRRGWLAAVPRRGPPAPAVAV